MYIGAEHIISPLGMGAKENFAALLKNKTGICKHSQIGFDKKDLYVSKIDDSYFNTNFRFDKLLEDAIQNTIKQSQNLDIEANDVLIIISSTKGNIDHLSQENEAFSLCSSAQRMQEKFNLAHFPLLISNACISGVMAINTAANLIENKKYKHIICVGADIVSNFVLWGFQSLFAISNAPCQPFDKNRKGISMGEGAASVLVSEDETIFKEKPVHLLQGFTTNDANHISGPSRTGEGLYRAIKQSLEKHQVAASEIDYISAHGTATNYNDEMESIAFSRLNLLNAPLNSLKAYYGHTLGAAGLIETVVAMQSIRNQTLIKSLGYETQGTSHKLNIIKENKAAKIDYVLKSASGFGGCNAALLLKK